MKKAIIAVLFLSGSTFLSCNKDKTENIFPFEAEVLGMNNDCGYYSIRFTDNLQKANEIAGTLHTQYTFIAKNLPADLQVDGQTIILNIRRIGVSEISACTDMGPAYPWIYVLEARKKR